MSFYGDFAPVYERIFPLRPPVLRAVVELLGAPPLRVLDVGCGSGRLCGELQALGHEALGIDLDPEMIAAAGRLYPEAAFRVLDMRRVAELEGPIAAALCLGNVLPHLAADDLVAFLADLHARLASRAVWLVQTVNYDRLAGRNEWTFPDLAVDDGYVFQRAYDDLNRRRCRFRTRLLRDGDIVFSGEVEMTPAATEDLVAVHRAAGFTLESIAADFAGTAYDSAASPGRLLLFRRT